MAHSRSNRSPAHGRPNHASIQTDALSNAITLESLLTVIYALDDWTVTSQTLLEASGWIEQLFVVEGLLGLLIIDSELSFDVPGAAFDEWEAYLSMNLAAVELLAGFDLQPGDAQMLFEIVANPDQPVEAFALLLGDGSGCDLDLNLAIIGLEFTFCECTKVRVLSFFECAGFQYIEMQAEGMSIPHLPWLMLAAELRFEVDQKQLVVYPAFDFGETVCFELHFAVTEDAPQAYPTDIL